MPKRHPWKKKQTVPHTGTYLQHIISSNRVLLVTTPKRPTICIIIEAVVFSISEVTAATKKAL